MGLEDATALRSRNDIYRRRNVMRNLRGPFALEPFLAGALAVVIGTVAVLSTRDDRAAIGVMAQEVGHHLPGHTITAQGSRPAMELEADDFSGFVLGRFGASLADAQAAIQALAGDGPGTTYLGKQVRLATMGGCWWWWYCWWWGWC